MAVKYAATPCQPCSFGRWSDRPGSTQCAKLECKAGTFVDYLYGYRQVTYRNCDSSNQIHSYNNMREATVACTRDTRCKAIYDSGCDGRGTLYTCSTVGKTTSSSGYCTRIKPQKKNRSPNPIGSTYSLRSSTYRRWKQAAAFEGEDM